MSNRPDVHLDDQGDAGTTLSEEECEGLIPSYITIRRELNEAEQANILEAQEWAFARNRDVLSEKFLNPLHKQMFGNVWRWAGCYRKTGKNIDVDAYRIPQDLRQLLDDCRYWMKHSTYEPDEIAVRFHHKLVWIHPDPNGNGRHARFATDLLLGSTNCTPFTWGANLFNQATTRRQYIGALRESDKHYYQPLMQFVRS